MDRNELDYHFLFSGNDEDYILFKRFIGYAKTSIKNYRILYFKKTEKFIEMPYNDMFPITPEWTDLESTLSLIEQVENNCLLHALLSLSLVELQILDNHIVENLTFYEISYQMRIPVNKVRSIYHNTLRKLRNNLEGYDEFFF